VLAELFLDVFVWDTVLDHLVELVADFFGEASDFTAGAMGRGGDGWCGGGRDLIHFELRLSPINSD